MEQNLDTFADPTPIEPNQNANNSPQPPEIDTFDNMEPVEPTDVGGNEEGEKKVDPKSQVKNLDEEKDEKEEKKEDADKKTEKKEEKKEDDKKGDESSEQKDESKDEDKTSAKKIKVKDGDKTVELSDDATVKVKVKGKNQFVSISDLKRDFSGKEAWDADFKKLEEKNQDITLKSQKFEQERNEVAGHLGKIGKILDDEKKNPLDALYYLVDISGRDPLEFNKKVMDYLSDEVRTLDEMDETERKLYWRDKEVAAIRSNQAAKAEQSKQTEAREEQIAKIDKLRESQGVTEEQFVQSYDELKSLGYDEKKITPEAAIEYAVNKPFFEKAEDLTSKHVAELEDSLSDDDMDLFVSEVAKTLRSFPKLSDKKAIEVTLDNLGWDYETDDDELKKLSDEAGDRDGDKKPSPKKVAAKEDGPESFDDFDQLVYG
jgi:hypothetical protein